MHLFKLCKRHVFTECRSCLFILIKLKGYWNELLGHWNSEDTLWIWRYDVIYIYLHLHIYHTKLKDYVLACLTKSHFTKLWKAEEKKTNTTSKVKERKIITCFLNLFYGDIMYNKLCHLRYIVLGTYDTNV